MLDITRIVCGDVSRDAEVAVSIDEKYLPMSEATPFKLAGLALFMSRELEQREYFSKWRHTLEKFDALRGRIDPIADQTLNIDVLLRFFESELAILTDEERGENTSGLQLHIQLSRLWVLGAYEFLRSLHTIIKDHNNPDAACLRETNSKGCGKKHA